MFILRRITSRGQESNDFLGDGYNLIKEHDKESEKEFKDLIKPLAHPDEVFGFVVFNNGADYLPLYRNSTYYVMCSDGKTFDNISFK